jgi:hypothetical protein
MQMGIIDQGVNLGMSAFDKILSGDTFDVRGRCKLNSSFRAFLGTFYKR